ncbi:MAG: hypothetical protein AAGE52_38680, partial [Myxococcota bacterium]
LGDHRGDLWMIGTPNATCTGYFYNACTGADGFEKWSAHHWDARDNTHFPDAGGGERFLRDTLKTNGWTEEHPVFKREYLGLWFRDKSGLVYPYDPELNTVEALPRPANEWRYVLAMDFGVVDACAFSILAYHPHENSVYVVESFKRDGTSPSTFVEIVRNLQVAYYKIRFGHPPRDREDAEHAFDTIVGDTVGTGKPFCQELLERTGLYVVPAQKSAKLAFIAHMAGDLQHGKIKVIPSRCKELTDEWEKLPWDDEAHTRYNDRKYDDHACDATLYGWRECRPYDATDEVFEPEPGTPAWYERQAAREESELARRVQREQAERNELYGTADDDLDFDAADSDYADYLGDDFDGGMW